VTSFHGTITGLSDVIRLMNRVAPASKSAMEIGMRRGTLLGQSIVRGNASGRPGPRNVTGDFRRSIVGDTEVAGDKVLSQIGTNAAQALRLELGFYGVDVLGRKFSQPPYPYMGRSVDAVIEAYRSEVTKAFERLNL
jgi:hypothetical protein